MSAGHTLPKITHHTISDISSQPSITPAAVAATAAVPLCVNIPAGGSHNATHREDTLALPLISQDNSVAHNDSDWTRCIDKSNNIYYVNNINGESAWLAPCCSCLKPSDRWCLQCKLAYCKKDFARVHTLTTEGKDTSDRSKHRWCFQELQEPTRLEKDEANCISCDRNIGSKMCMDCWDPYCQPCFKAAHHNGALRQHRALPYQRAKLGWIFVRSDGRLPDYYVNGTTGTATQDKPVEMMTDMEKVMLKSCEVYASASKGHIELIEKLRAELIRAELDRDNALIESGKVLQEIRAKAREKETEALSQQEQSGGGLLGLFGRSGKSKSST